MDNDVTKLFSRFRDENIEIDDTRMLASLQLRANVILSTAEKSGHDQIREDDNYLYVTFRALSMTAFPWRCLYVDFSKDGVLKKAYKFLNGQTVYSNHDTKVENWKGVVAESRWDESVTIPAGINTRLRISKKGNEKVVDGIKERAIHSVSVNVLFEYEKSHPELEDFWFLMGEEIDGSIVRLIATKIISFGEISLVWQGADAFAKRIGLSQDNRDRGSRSDINKTIIPGGETVKLTRTMATLCMLNLAEYGFSAVTQEVTLDEAGVIKLQQDLSRIIADFTSKNAALEQTLKDVLKTDDISTDLENKAKAIKENAVLGLSYLNDIRQEALKYAKLSEKSDNLEETAIGKAILNAGLDDAKQFRETYRAKAEEQFPAVCPECGSSVSRASASRDSTNNEEQDSEIDMNNYEM